MIRRNTSLTDCTFTDSKAAADSIPDVNNGSNDTTTTMECGDHPAPFLLRPAAKDYLWGGQRLNDDFSKGIDLNPLAETWECSTHPDGPSVVASGIYAGKTLTEVLNAHPEYLGTHPQSVYKDELNPLPVLIKFIDAKKDLSIQVHPSDEYAASYEHGQLGKTEMWYVIGAEKGPQLVYGFKTDVTADQVRKGAEDGSIENLLQYVGVHKEDVFFIKSGTVHAIGAGCLIAEIQESPNLTYRLYDYNRAGADGKKRELHIDKALDVANLESSSSPRQPLSVLQYKPGYSSELIGRCKYFQVECVLINTERIRNMADIASTVDSFTALLCIDGCADMFSVDESNNTLINIFKGDCVFIPAGSERLKLHGKAEFLKIRC